MVAMTTATITRPMPVHPHLRFGIGATPIRVITLRYPNARFRGDKLLSDGWAGPRPLRGGVRRVIQLFRLDPVGSRYGDVPAEQTPLRQRARSRETPSSNRPRVVGPRRSPSSSSDVLRSRTVVYAPCSRTSEPIHLSHAM